jgi:hypothetical protein
MRRRWVFAFLTITGCVHAPFTGPARGGPSWTRVSSEHFTVTTSVAADDATKTCAELETMLEGLSTLAFGARQLPRMRIEIVLFSRLEEYEGVADRLSSGQVFLLGRHDFERTRFLRENSASAPFARACPIATWFAASPRPIEQSHFLSPKAGSSRSSTRSCSRPKIKAASVSLYGSAQRLLSA